VERTCCGERGIIELLSSAYREDCIMWGEFLSNGLEVHSYPGYDWKLALIPPKKLYQDVPWSNRDVPSGMYFIRTLRRRYSRKP